ncbi:swi5-dependent recombination DNA repair protein 1 homolog [Bombina bombina]|uniref:swi5-dependent recombination DNA repair protein 1 homolog n=1 Tax=Bombina bombina TaxID=8345 RepID=UPI00235A49DB|nr:swi5-dependent recombination DNA repair protein 1 homolog [Bombina bombina]XP_053547690.1 swi5-dependent recombination DNA repair protein 1 homolog [Bombina bombina]
MDKIYIFKMNTPTPSASCSRSENNLSSPDPQNNIVAKQPMSATLRERLRKTRRSFSSVFSVAKRLKIDDTESTSSVDAASDVPAQVVECEKSTLEKTQSISVACKSKLLSPCKLTPSTIFKNENINQDMFQEKMLLKQIKEKEEILRQLKMVKLYRSKNNLAELQKLIEKWRKACQCMIYELQANLSTENRRLTLTELMDSFGLDDTLLSYNRAEEDFEDI